MEIRQLQYFLSAARRLNFTKAAEECCIVQSAMTQQIAALERELGVKLFEGRRRDMRLTLEGEALYQEAARLVEEMERTAESVRSVSEGYRRTLRMGYHGNMMHRELPGILAEFHRSFPQVKIRLGQEKVVSAIEKLKREALDCMFCLYWPELAAEEELEYRILRKSRVKLLTSAQGRLAKWDRVGVKELSEEPLIFFDGAEVKQSIQHLAEKGLSPKIYDRVDCHNTLIALVEGGYGSALCVEDACPRDDPRVVLLDVDIVGEERQVCVAWKRGGRMREEYLELIQRHYEVPGEPPQGEE